MTEQQTFYGVSSLKDYDRQDVLDGHIIKINPALITITDGLVDKFPRKGLQERVRNHVIQLLEHKIRSFHVDVNFEDYSGFNDGKPDMNKYVFTPSFLENLTEIIRSNDGFLNLHLLTDFPHHHLSRYNKIDPGAVCFQLEVIPDLKTLKEIVRFINDIGSCASPVIETVGSSNLIPKSEAEVYTFLNPVLPEIGMLTFQAAGTASRSNVPAGTFHKEKTASYIGCLRPHFTGTIQIQGGIKISTIREAVKMGAEFLVTGSQIFRNPEGMKSSEVIDRMLREAAEILGV